MGDITKNQHYVPQFLLKGFGENSSNGKINIYDIPREQIRMNQAVSSVFSQNYFYDTDNKVENYLCDNVEGPASLEIEKIRNNDFSSLNSNSNLITFMCCQNTRTPEAKEDALNFINVHFEQIVAKMSELNGWDIKNPEEFRVLPSDKDAMRDFTGAVALNGVIDSLGMRDLRFHVLINKTEQKFIISDHPIARYNWLYRDLNTGQSASMAAKGIQMFLPITPRITLCAYDASTYKYGDKRYDYSELKNVTDVEWLNQLQARPAQSFIGFGDVSQASYVQNLIKRYNGKRIYDRKSKDLCKEELDAGKLMSSYLVYTTQMKLRYKPSFLKLLKKSRIYSESYSERNPELTRLLDEFRRQK